MKIVLILESIVDSNEMPTLGLHCLPTYLFSGIKDEKGLLCVRLTFRES